MVVAVNTTPFIYLLTLDKIILSLFSILSKDNVLWGKKDAILRVCVLVRGYKSNPPAK
jgi:hypothetical protein